MIVHSWNSSTLRSNLPQLQCTYCTVPTTSGRRHESPLRWACQWPSSQPLSSPQLSHNDSLCALGITKSRREQGMDYRERTHLGQIVCNKDGVVDWALPTESLLELPSNLNSVTLSLTITLWRINSSVLTCLLLPHLSWSLTNSLPSLNILCHSKTDAQFMQDGRKAVWSIPFVSVAFFQSLKRIFIAYRSSKVSSRPDCLFEIYQLRQSGRIPIPAVAVHLNLKSKIGQSSHKTYSNNILNFHESTIILNACTKMSGN